MKKRSEEKSRPAKKGRTKLTAAGIITEPRSAENGRGVSDQEVKRIIDECYNRAKQIIHEYDDVLHACADLLLQKEKISRDEFESLFEGRA